MDRPLQILIKPSRIARYYCLIVLLLAFFAIALTSFVLWIKVLLAATVCTYVAAQFRQLQRSTFSLLEWQDETWCLHSEMEKMEVLLEQRFFSGAGIISLPFRKQSGKRVRLLLWPDSTDEESLRRLRVRLLAL
jgi:hypothetical protein